MANRNTLKATVDPNKKPDFLAAYMNACGVSEVPDVYHMWSAYSLMAACMGRSIWFNMLGSKIHPNLYVFLIGNSASGKNVAIDRAANLVRPHKEVYSLRGNLTAKGLIDHLGTKSKRRRDELSTPLFYITAELGMSMGREVIAAEMLKHMTELYSGQDYVLDDINRTTGARSVRAPLINWLAGSTIEWLIECVSRSSIEGGFFARCIPAIGERKRHPRIPQPNFPENLEEIESYLHDCISQFCQVEGSFEMTREAESIDYEWYMTRKEPSREDLLPTWDRQQVLAIKLAMLCSISQNARSGEITKDHVQLGQRMSQIVLNNTPRIIDLASVNKETSCIHALEKIVYNKRDIRYIDVLRKMSNRYNASKISDAIITLELQRKIRVENRQVKGEMGGSTTRTVKWLHWISTGKLMSNKIEQQLGHSGQVEGGD